VDAVLRDHTPHALNAFLDDPGIFFVEEHSKPEDAAPMAGDAAVTKVKAKQVNVVGPELGEVMPVLLTTGAFR
jgi:hypothetical protein